MPQRIEVSLKEEFYDSEAAALQKRLHDDFSLTSIKGMRISSVFTFEDSLTPGELQKVGRELLSDSVSQHFFVDSPSFSAFSAAIEVSLRPGVKDSAGETAKEGAEDCLGKPLAGGVYTSKIYFFEGDFPRGKAQAVAEGLLCNPLISEWRLIVPEQIFNYYSFFYIPKAGARAKGTVIEIPLDGLPDHELLRLSRSRLLALSVGEMKAIMDYFSLSKVAQERKKFSLDSRPTDVELECLAQTWSEHCKHKIFNATIDYEEETQGEGKKKKTRKKERINSLFKTYICQTTKKIGRKINYLVSVFDDNAGIVKLTPDFNMVMKVETHNTPSALDPYGGALTGILGVNRDVICVGIGAKPIFNTDIFCFANPFYAGKIPPRLLHPRRVFEGVRAGVERGGNASGIPTINGSIFFDDRYLGKPLVYCGTGGIMPAKVNGKPSHEKPIMPSDRIFTVGGRIGKDGIHGATFSSEGLHEGSPTSAVQLGDPITQKNALDFLLAARDAGLVSGLQDMGAGGLSSAVGEMAQITGGAVLHLERAPLKYSGLNPWEILLSESQERMMASVPAGKAGEFASLAKDWSVEANDIGEFTASGHFHVLYHGYTVLYLSLKFLHGGLPKMKLHARWEGKKLEEPDITMPDLTAALLALLSRPNICSKESVIRQYDHEVKGMSVVKPLCGVAGSGPSDSAVLQPLYPNKLGIVVSHGMAVHAGDIDPYHMAMLAVDEAARNYIAAGGDPLRWAALDNFCWPDPVQSSSNPDGDLKLGALVRTNRGLAQACIDYSIPLISGKDSMKNDYKNGEWKISVPPTLLVSMIGTISNVERAVTTDFKREGDFVYVIGETSDELGGSEYYSMGGHTGRNVPKVDTEKNLRTYKKLHRAIMRGLVASAHDASDGGIGVALSECCIGGRVGCRADLREIPLASGAQGMREDKILFSESAGRFVASVHPNCAQDFEEEMHGTACAKIGQVGGDALVVSTGKGSSFASAKVAELEAAFKKTITW